MYAKSTRPSAKRDDRIARPSALKLAREASCARSARWECAREAGRFFFFYCGTMWLQSKTEVYICVCFLLCEIISVTNITKRHKLQPNTLWVQKFECTWAFMHKLTLKMLRIYSKLKPQVRLHACSQNMPIYSVFLLHSIISFNRKADCVKSMSEYQ